MGGSALGASSATATGCASASTRWCPSPTRAGRFARSGGELERVLGAWEPNEAQRHEIASGLRVDARGAREKRLRPDASGFSSARGAFDSARVVGFESRVELDLSGAAPRIVLVDSLGSSAAQALEGRTEFRGERITADGDVEGRFDRDGTPGRQLRHDAQRRPARPRRAAAGAAGGADPRRGRGAALPHARAPARRGRRAARALRRRARGARRAALRGSGRSSSGASPTRATTRASTPPTSSAWRSPSSASTPRRVSAARRSAGRLEDGRLRP